MNDGPLRRGALHHAEEVARVVRVGQQIEIEKAIRAVKEKGAKQLLVAGGVAANRGLRAALQEAATAEGIQLVIPPLDLCGDNAGMIGVAAHHAYVRGKRDTLAMNAVPGLSLEESMTV